MDEEQIKKIVNKDEALEVVSANGYNYYFLNDDLKNDRDVAFCAVHAEFDAIDFIPNKFKSDKSFILDLIIDKPMIAEHISINLQDDVDVMFLAIKGDGYALGCASHRLKNNILMVLEAVKNTPEAIHFASKEIQQIAVNENNAEENLKAFIKASNLLKKLDNEIPNNNTNNNTNNNIIKKLKL